MVQLTPLPERGVIAVEGDDRVAFLQGLVSNDIEAVRPGHAVWAALLTAQGKWLADFFVFTDGNALLLDCEAEQVPMLIQRLSRYRLRMNATLAPRTGASRPRRLGRPAARRRDRRPRPQAARPRLAHSGRRTARRERDAGRLGPPPPGRRPARMGRRTWRRIAASCWKPASMNLPAYRGRKAATWARNSPLGRNTAAWSSGVWCRSPSTARCRRPAARCCGMVSRSAPCAPAETGSVWRRCGWMRSAPRCTAPKRRWCHRSRMDAPAGRGI